MVAKSANDTPHSHASFMRERLHAVMVPPPILDYVLCCQLLPLSWAACVVTHGKFSCREYVRSAHFWIGERTKGHKPSFLWLRDSAEIVQKSYGSPNCFSGKSPSKEAFQMSPHSSFETSPRLHLFGLKPNGQASCAASAASALNVSRRPAAERSAHQAARRVAIQGARR